MNYSDFMHMQPEFVLVLGLIIVFFADFFAHRNADSKKLLWMLTSFMLMSTISSCLIHNEPTTAFGGIYVTSAAINVMKAILAFGTLIVVIMSNSWAATRQRIAGEFYMLHDDVIRLVPAVLPGLGDGFSASGLYGGFRSPS